MGFFEIPNWPDDRDTGGSFQAEFLLLFKLLLISFYEKAREEDAT